VEGGSGVRTASVSDGGEGWEGMQHDLDQGRGEGEEGGREGSCSCLYYAGAR